MATQTDEQVLTKIKDTYVPFLKKLIGFLEKNKKATPDNLNKLKAIHQIFTTAPSREQVETFHANEKKLENWYKKAQKEKHGEDGELRGTKRGLVLSDNESSQGASDSSSSFNKRKTFSNSVSNESTQPSIASVQSVTPMPIHQIKKEKLDAHVAAKPPAPAATVAPKPVYTPAAPIAPSPAPAPAAVPSANDPIIFTCASCQFQTKDETDFMKHARTDHRTDLSMWCKNCGKCFSNAGVLVSHIKERACVKEEMIYKCGVKDCVFETTSGQTFVHHLRHCHKGSPFIFCVHCQKIFTLPHCLILHMQDDCPFKEKNRRNPGAVVRTETPAASPVTPAPTAVIQPIMRTPAPISAAPTPIQPAIRPSLPSLGTPLRGRGRAGIGRGRGRGRSLRRMSSSDSDDDPDDPIWRPEETLDESTVRRSARWAKKVNDVRNPEPSTSGITPSKKSFTDAEIHTDMIKCPCCEFLAAFQSVLEDHYIANHKVPNKNACLVCHLKFENTRSFLDHFEEHRKGLIPNLSQVAESLKSTEPPKATTPPIKATPTPPPIKTTPPPTKVNLPSITNTQTVTEESPAVVAPSKKDGFDYILTSIEDAHLATPKPKNEPGKIPYQAAIHDKNMKDSKLKKFEELKSPTDLTEMKTPVKLKHFFKCGLYNCSFTSDDSTEFSSHLLLKHEGKRYHCCYCLKEYFNCDSMASHIASNHNKRQYQCSKCFYRAFSKPHVQIHLNNFHGKEPDAEILFCELVTNPNTSELDEVSEAIDTTWPYVCAIGDCSYNTYDPQEFKRHNETAHRTCSVFYCHYCKVDFVTFKRLMNHYRLHGLNTFQCNYCIHGADTKEEILLHLSNSHADLPLKAFMRGSHEDTSSEAKKLNSICEDSNSNSNDTITESRKSFIDTVPASVKESLLDYEKELYHVIDNKYYPKELQLACFPRFRQNLVTNIVCGIPFCETKFDTIPLYISHLRNVHDALNFPCPHCAEKFNFWEDFKNHLLCHGSKLYVCSSKDCGFYDWSKERVKQHKNMHQSTDNVFAVREYSSDKNEEFMVNTLELPCEIPKADTPLMCIFCRYKCSDKSIMKNHMYRELNYLRFNCRLCDKRYLSRKDVKSHFNTAHPGLDIICSTDNNSEVEAIVKTILKFQDKFQEVKLKESCVMCCRKIRDPMRLQCHQYICLQKEYRPYECNHCKRKCINLLSLVYHSDQEHADKEIDCVVSNNYAIEDDIGKGLLKARLKQLKDFFQDLKVEIDYTISSKLKFYTCSVCPFEADHKFSVQKHIKEQHEDKHGVVIKAMQRVDSIENSHSDENSSDGTSFKAKIKQYSCGFCTRKMYTIQELENHVKRTHPAKIAEEYFYYYNPDENTQFSPDDKDTYECAYCKSSRENLHSLKSHADLMHSEMDFKVKGYVTRVQSQNYFACGHCYLQMLSDTELQNHSTLSHPMLGIKAIGDLASTKAKRSNESADEIPNKRVKLGSIVYVCSHCGAAFQSQELVTNHSKRAHKSSKLEFCRIDQASNGIEQGDIKFYKCEFCKFTSERHYLDKHLATKHKMRVTCFYCQKRFEFASKLKEHHDVAHKDLPLKYSQETVNISTIPSSDSSLIDVKETPENNVDMVPENTTIPSQPFSFYGKQPEPVDLESLTVDMDTKDGPSAKLSVVYVTKLFNMFPKVVLKDCMKDKKTE